MSATDEEIQKLTNQLKESGIQIAVLSAKYEAVTASAQKFSDELFELRAKHKATTLKLQ
jgi:hypothetical protein